MARFGGDELAVLAPEVKDAEGALAVARRLLASLERPLTLHGRELPVTAPAGVVPVDVLRRADAAMSLAERRGRAQAALFEDALAVEATHRLVLAGGLQRALRQRQLDLAYQPLVALRSDRVAAAEALVRWPGPGSAPPATFVPVAEETGPVHAPGRFGSDRTCADLARLRSDAACPTDFHLSINLSARQLEDDGIVNEVARTLERHEAPGNRLLMETTETAVATDWRAARRRLGALRGLEARVALDDLSTGLSSLAAPADLPIDVSKIDEPFVDDLGAPPRGRPGRGRPGPRLWPDGDRRGDRAPRLCRRVGPSRVPPRPRLLFARPTTLEALLDQLHAPGPGLDEDWLPESTR